MGKKPEKLHNGCKHSCICINRQDLTESLQCHFWRQSPFDSSLPSCSNYLEIHIKFSPLQRPLNNFNEQMQVPFNFQSRLQTYFVIVSQGKAITFPRAANVDCLSNLLDRFCAKNKKVYIFFNINEKSLEGVIFRQCVQLLLKREMSLLFLLAAGIYQISGFLSSPTSQIPHYFSYRQFLLTDTSLFEDNPSLKIVKTFFCSRSTLFCSLAAVMHFKEAYCTNFSWLFAHRPGVGLRNLRSLH